METKSLTYGIIGFLLGGLVVSLAAAQPRMSTDTMDNSEMTMSMMTDDLKNKTGDDFDETFITSMIMHHEGAIDMAKLAEENAKHDEIKQLADEILSAQSKEIDMMQTWQADWGYKNTPMMSH